MSRWQREYRTDRQLWLVCGLVAFVVLGAVVPVSYGKHEEGAIWEVVWFLIRHADNPYAWLAVGLALGFWGLLLTGVAAAWGWVAQAVVRVIWPRSHPTAHTQTTAH